MAETQSQSYREYVTRLSLDYPEYGWLRDFLSHPGANPSVTRVLLLDSVDDNLRAQDFLGSSQALAEALKRRPEDVQFRVVVVSYFQSWNIDRDVVDTLGIHFRLDPLFLWGHLDHYYASNDALCPPSFRHPRQTFVEHMPSEHISVEVGCVGTGMSATFLDDGSRGGDNDTVVVFSRDSVPCISSLSRFSGNRLRASDFEDLPAYLQNMPSSRFNAALKKFSPDEVRSANRTPLEYVIPFARLVLIELNQRVQQTETELESQFTFGAAGNATTEILEGSWAVLHDFHLDLSASLRSLSASTPSEPTTRVTSLLEDCRYLTHRIERIQQDLRDYLNRHVAMASLRESRLGVEASERSIAQAKSINRLTKLAFVFIPLSFVSSVFGMNFKELGTGQLSIWIFGVTASLLVVLVAMTAFGLSKLPERRLWDFPWRPPKRTDPDRKTRDP
ncbi:hypothetical protein GP486_002366 [Trichoglossum hirsutum]|uniref:Uncharacterized protein n=1 Tax=Trichoglossum hirsutum TaxID=265104 RepID=A0A9P8LF34_9PEZI|nr:hypothetical protein GP486_002366 [Trichoglossum hirsutum]